ncbi:MAG: flagellar protein FliT [Candidatus Schekmanbacteria bacterium]|nr:flagellar protein FliT [Candidatus Schekmanbacteria bacterium]
MALKFNLVQNKLQLYQKIYDIASKEREAANKSNYGQILFLQDLRQKIFNQIEKIDESIKNEKVFVSKQNYLEEKSPRDDDSQTKVIEIIKNILKIDEETLKVVNQQRDETLSKIEQVGNAKRQLNGYGLKKSKASGFFDDSI